MTTILNKYIIHCNNSPTTEKHVWEEDGVVPNYCPTDPVGHTIDETKTFIDKTLAENEVTVKEETSRTGGHFTPLSVKIDAVKNTTTIAKVIFPFKISALKMEYVTTNDHWLDTVSVNINKDTITGVLSSGVTKASAWVDQNYTVGNIVTYTTTDYDERVYTCIKNTVSNEIPTDKTYWVHGFELPVTSTVITYGNVGYYIKVSDDDMGRVVSMDKINNKIYMENNLTSASFSVATPIKQTVYYMKDHVMGHPWDYEVGDSKIGGTSVEKDYIIRVEYTNKSTTDDKTFIGYVHYLY